MSFISDTFKSITGQAGAEAATEGAQLQAQAGQEAIVAQQEAAQRAQQFFEPFQPIVQQGIEQAGFLADPQAQFEFLQNNPLFQLALDEAQRGTQQSAAASGRLSAGDTLQQLSQNTLLAAQPLIGQQRQDITNLLNLGTGLAQTQGNIEIGQGSNVGNLLTDIGAAQAAGGVGAATARGAGAENLISAGTAFAQSDFGGGLIDRFTNFALSDIRLKENIQYKGDRNGCGWYQWDWNQEAEALGKSGHDEGHLAQEVALTRPDCVGEISGYMAVNYEKLESN